MPFESEAQRRFMFAQHPRIAKRWAKHTPKSKDLPEKKTDSDPEETQAKAEAEKKAYVRLLGINLGLVKNADTEKPKSTEIVNQGVPGLLADMFPYLHASRAGRATALAKSIGMPDSEIPTILKYPIATDVGAGVLGAILGIPARMPIPGAALAAWIKRMVGNSDIRQIAKKFDEGQIVNTSNADGPTSGLRIMMMPFAGFHDKGVSDTLKYLGGRSEKPPRFDAMDYLTAIPIVGDALAGTFGFGKGFAAAYDNAATKYLKNI